MSEEVSTIGVKLSLVVAPELLVVVEGEVGATVVLGATGELGAAGELGTRGTDVVEVIEVVHSVVVVGMTVVIVYYIGNLELALAPQIGLGDGRLEVTFKAYLEGKQRVRHANMPGSKTYGTVCDSRVAGEDSQSRSSAQRIGDSLPSTSLEGKGAEGDDND
jgi:hypothetical protein